ncbi:MAG: winged helix-turn-helix domain-containing protein [Enterobacteriaceae bacterium]|nr:winged helix-turn-helix domain-containing protein [Enterobacteriaceae bacterium]
MGKFYLINELVEFHPDEQRLSLYQEENKFIILASPAARCLMLLIEQYPNSVKHDDFYNIVWQDRHGQVPANTLYQNISLIRRGFKTLLGEDQEIIMTIPRYGFKLDSHVSIKTMTYANDIDDTTLSPVVNEEGIQTIKNKKINNNVMLLLSIIIFIISLFFALTNLHGTPAFYQDYSFSKNKKECLIYINPEYPKTLSYDSLQEHSPLSCKSFPYTYISAYNFSSTVSIIRCDRPIESDAKCVSYIYKGADNS